MSLTKSTEKVRSAVNKDRFKGKRFFLTGGTGFFGKSILDMVKRGFAENSSFTILSREPDAFLRQNPCFAGMDHVTFHRGDIRDFEFPACEFDCLIHAATPAVTTLAPGEMRSIILEGTERILAFARQCKAQRLLFVSSGAVYGPQPEWCENLAEDFPCAPVTEYGIAKLEAEKMCLNSGVECVIARCFAFIGPYLNLDIHFAAGNFLGDCLRKKDIIIKGDGTPLRSYLYADDLVEWLFAILEKGRAGEAYNVGSPQGISISALAKEMASHFEPAPAVRIMERAVPGRAPAQYVPDVSKIGKELGVSIKVPLSEAITLCKKFHLEHRDF